MKKKIASIIKQSKIKEDPNHSLLVRDWLLRLYHKASEELQIAALSHDIDRAVESRVSQKEGESYDNYELWNELKKLSGQ